MARRQTPKQRRASLRNLKKARAARKGTRRRAAPRRRIIRRRSTPRNVRGGSTNRSPKIGAWLRGARTIDVISAPFQGTLTKHGISQEAVKSAGRRYLGGFAGGSPDDVITTVKAVGTGVARNIITSKSGAYRGVGQKKILSYVQALAPEIVAAAETNPVADPKRWNSQRHRAYEGYRMGAHTQDFGDPMFIQSISLQAGAWGVQKAAQMLGINKMLPKGVNL